MISKRTLADVTMYTDAIKRAMDKNDANLILDSFEESDLGKSVYQYGSVYSTEIAVSVSVPSGVVAEQVINWWKSRIDGLRVKDFEDLGTDGINPYRRYRMNNRSADEELRVEINCYFAQGTCEFVEVDTGETEEVPERPAEAAFVKVVTRKVLKCDDQVIPTGLPEPATALEA